METRHKTPSKIVKEKSLDFTAQMITDNYINYLAFKNPKTRKQRFH